MTPHPSSTKNPYIKNSNGSNNHNNNHSNNNNNKTDS